MTDTAKTQHRSAQHSTAIPDERRVQLHGACTLGKLPVLRGIFAATAAFASLQPLPLGHLLSFLPSPPPSLHPSSLPHATHPACLRPSRHFNHSHLHALAQLQEYLPHCSLREGQLAGCCCLEEAGQVACWGKLHHDAQLVACGPAPPQHMTQHRTATPKDNATGRAAGCR